MKALKRFSAVVAALALTVGMCANVMAKPTWGHYIGFDEGNTWYEASEGSFKLNSDTSWTATMNTLGWGGVWGYQVYQDSSQGNGSVEVKKGQEYTLKCTLKSSKLDKWVVIKIATKENIAFAKWVQLKKGQSTTINETFTAKCDANSIYFGLGGDFGDREDEKDLYTWAEGGQKSIDDGDPTKSTVITCTDYSLAAPVSETAATGGSTNSVSTGTATTTTTAVATGDFAPIACGAAAIVAAAVIVVFARKREND
jgi:hypothetical protein